jgi:hypothetical protein
VFNRWVIGFFIYEGHFTFFLDEKSNKKIKPRIFLHQKSSNRFISLDSYFYWCSMNLSSFGFSYRDPSRFARGSLPSASAQILIVILDVKI